MHTDHSPSPETHSRQRTHQGEHDDVVERSHSARAKEAQARPVDLRGAQIGRGRGVSEVEEHIGQPHVQRRRGRQPGKQWQPVAVQHVLCQTCAASALVSSSSHTG